MFVMDAWLGIGIGLVDMLGVLLFTINRLYRNDKIGYACVSA